MAYTTSIFKSNERLTCELKTVFIPSNFEGIENDYQKKLHKKLVKHKEYLDSMISLLKNYFISSNDVINIDENKYYIRKLNAVFQIPSELERRPPKLKSRNEDDFATREELITITSLKKHINFRGIEGFFYFGSKGIIKDYISVDDPINNHLGSEEYYAYLPIKRYNDTDIKFVLAEEMRIFLEKNIKPATSDDFDKYFEYYKYISVEGESITIDFEKAYSELQNKVTTIAKNYFCDSDNRRANLSSYDETLLYEHTQGHWDLADAKSGNKVTVTLDKPFYARNPYKDIKKNSVIGIDFGTTSTVVVLLDPKDKPYLLPVGGNYSTPKKTDMENPTILHLCDINSFIAQYSAKAGRPDTSFFDLTISHTAAKELMQANEKNYYSFITSLKQWVATENEIMELLDDKEIKISIPPYLHCKDGDLDPVEIYAYYIGTALNNMKQHTIYSKYLLSFPVSFEKAVKDKLCQSFRRGLIKSLPNVLAKDRDFLKNDFTVTSWTSEPAAYAVCALQSYGFKPKDENDIHYYGVFDFGGGTTDFDFGLWRGASGKNKEEGKDYVIDHFDAGDSRLLGGENILEYLSFKVFSDELNQDKLRKTNTWFTFPRGEQKIFSGYETVIKNDSKWANQNMYRMKEALRPIWEKHEGYEGKYPDNTIDCLLFNNDGVQQSNIRLNIDLDLLNEVIKERVHDGVKSFMAQMVFAMRKRNPLPQKINIFLAGNSCKAAIVKTIFIEECKNFESDYREELLKQSKELEEKVFIIYPPLGTVESDEKIKERKLEVNKIDNSRPTGKTGVAIGLVLSRPGSQILVENANVDIHGEKSFSFLVGKNTRDEFKPVLDFESKMEKWVQFRRANEKTIEFYFTRDSIGRTGKLATDKTERIICNLPKVKSDAFVFIRPVSPSEFEFKVSTTENGKPFCGVEKIKLADGK